MKPATLTPAEQVAVRARIAAGDTAREISESLGIVRKTLLAAVKRYELGPWLVRGSDRRGAPADFAEMAATMSNPQLAKHYGCGTCLPGRWRKELGLGEPPRMKSGPAPRVIPDDFKTWAVGKSLRAIAARYGMSHEMARRFRVQIGVQHNPVGKHVTPDKPAHLVRNAYMTAPVDRAVKDGSRAGLAADYLRRDAPVYRCRPLGAADANGSHWRYGRVVLSDAELIERAERKGWSADAWKQVRAA